MQNFVSPKELLDYVKNNDNIVIYGAGIIGQGLLCALNKLGLDKNIIGFAVSDGILKSLDEYIGKPVNYFSEYDFNKSNFIVAVKDQYFKGGIEQALSGKRYYRLDCSVVRSLFDENDFDIDLVLKERLSFLNLSDEEYVSFCIKQIRRYQLDFEVNICDHCNLNCKCCNHFSPVAEKFFLEASSYEKDLRRIAELTGGNVGRVWLLGGEPLLHPEISKFASLSRKYLPKTDISIFTNGTLVLRQPPEFWQTLRETGVKLILTKYQVNVDYDAIDKKAKEENVDFSYTADSKAVIKTTYHLPLDLDGSLNAAENYIKCFHANNCITLRNGRIYTCPIAPNAHHFNKFFDKHLSESEANSIDIYKAKNIEEILEFLKKPIQFCTHCNIAGYTFDLTWGISKKEIEEWT